MNAITLQKNTTFEHGYFDLLKDLLINAGIILFPTDTVWSIGCDASNPTAIERIYKLKQKNRKHPLILLVDSVAMLKKYVMQIHPRIETLMHYHTRPLTIIYDQPQNLSPNILGPNSTIAIRVINDPYCQHLISTLGKPLVATSANITEQTVPKNFGEVSSQIIQGVDYVAKYRRQEKTLGAPSVIVKYDKDGELSFIRG